MWFSVVCTLIGNDTLHHSDQNVVQQILTTVITRIVVDRSTHHAKPHSISFFLPQYQRNEINLCLDNWKHRLWFESARAALCKWAACTRQTFFSKTITHSLNMQKQFVKNVWEKSKDAYSLPIRVQTTKNHISICFLPQYQPQRKCFSQSASWKRHTDASSMVWTLIYHGKLANQIARLAAIVVKKIFLLGHLLSLFISLYQ